METLTPAKTIFTPAREVLTAATETLTFAKTIFTYAIETFTSAMAIVMFAEMISTYVMETFAGAKKGSSSAADARARVADVVRRVMGVPRLERCFGSRAKINRWCLRALSCC